VTDRPCYSVGNSSTANAMRPYNNNNNHHKVSISIDLAQHSLHSAGPGKITNEDARPTHCTKLLRCKIEF